MEARGGVARIGDETAVDAGENGVSDSEEQSERNELIIADSYTVSIEKSIWHRGEKGRKFGLQNVKNFMLR